ncbi:MAG: protein kinase domain-containing protein, partial [Planctomycetota bacterium]
PGCNALVDTLGEAPGTEIACRVCDHLLRVPEGKHGGEAEAGKATRLEGHRVGGYQLVREIGKGAMGVVYEAREQGTGRTVALKILPDTVGSDPQAIERFHREAALAAKADHPTHVPILEVGEEEGAFFIVLEFVEGETLETLLATSPLTIPLAVQTIWQAADGLNHAHERGIIHRDVKPANLLLDREGRVRILDFGLAKQRDVATITASGTVVGTPMYMSPEQASPGAQITFQTDIYSLGATLYEILTGVPPFLGENVHSLIRKVRMQEPPAPRSIRPDIPKPLENIVRKAMAKDPRRRYGTAAEFAADLKRFLDEGAVKARPPGLLDRSRAFLSRYREWMAVSLLAVSLLGGAWLLWWLQGPKKGSPGKKSAAGTTEALASEAFNALRLSRYEEAVRLYSQLRERRPADGEALLFRARAYRGLQQPEKALADLDQALALQPGWLRARFERGSLLLRMGRPQEAAKDLQRFVAARPEATDALMPLGEALSRSGRAREAMEAYRQVMVLAPTRGEAHLAFAELEVSENPESARDRLVRLAEAFPDLPRVHLTLGNALAACGALEEALKTYQEEVRRQGTDPALQEAIDRVRRQIEKRDRDR